MKLKELVPWLQNGHGIRGIPQTDVDNCPRGLLINITDLDEKQALKLALSLTPAYSDVEVVKIGIPKPVPVKKVEKPEPKKTIAEVIVKPDAKSSKKPAKGKKDAK